MGKKKTTSNSGKCKQEKGSAPNGDSQLAAGGELHQIAGGELHCRKSSRLTRWPACRSRWPRPNQGVPAGYCHEGCRQLDKECNLDSYGKRWRRGSTVDRTWFNH